MFDCEAGGHGKAGRPWVDVHSSAPGYSSSPRALFLMLCYPLIFAFSHFCRLNANTFNIHSYIVWLRWQVIVTVVWQVYVSCSLMTLGSLLAKMQAQRARHMLFIHIKIEKMWMGTCTGANKERFEYECRIWWRGTTIWGWICSGFSLLTVCCLIRKIQSCLNRF